MTTSERSNSTLFIDVWNSLRALPLWVQVWIMVWLVPINVVSLLFITQPMGLWIAILAIIGMLPNVPIILYERGFSKLTAVPHIIPWGVLVLLLIFARPTGTDSYSTYLWVLLATNSFSLIFDVRDVISWLLGSRQVVR